LHAVARLLSNASVQLPPSDAQLRRVVSTAYYALFHKVVQAAAQRFMGPSHEGSAGYALLYRSFDHRHMKVVCEALQVSTLGERFRYLLRRSAVSQDMRDFAGAFPALQEARHRADYDPTVEFLPSTVSSLVDAAEVAMDAFDRVAPEEQADVLALMMVKARN
jgi:uncharacterized protein (UPF0332 family)